MRVRSDVTRADDDDPDGRLPAGPGPYTLVREGCRPAGLDAGDFDIATDPDTVTARLYFEHPHTELISVDLTDDCTATTGEPRAHFPGHRPLATREAPAHFFRNGRHHLLTSHWYAVARATRNSPDHLASPASGFGCSSAAMTRSE